MPASNIYQLPQAPTASTWEAPVIVPTPWNLQLMCSGHKTAQYPRWCQESLAEYPRQSPHEDGNIQMNMRGGLCNWVYHTMRMEEDWLVQNKSFRDFKYK